MAAAPVESFKEGGMLWFKDLTVCDEYFALPAITCTTLWLTLEVSSDLANFITIICIWRVLCQLENTFDCFEPCFS